MVSIETAGDDVTLRVLGSHRMWAVKRTIRFKRQQVVTAAPAERGLWPPWCRCPGTALPWVIVAGTYYGRGRKEFWDHVRKGKAIRIDLRNGPYTRIVVDVADPETALAALAPPASGPRASE
ncbi:MAG: hypothetical protein BWZ02_01004 [Lentisphaerae bacterium ADurb.BinA184]|nr:MAG: hypothetical protein BWZ02_01004 [Lentisphaerae bacterium ADurb.BinA184]